MKENGGELVEWGAAMRKGEEGGGKGDSEGEEEGMEKIGQPEVGLRV